MRLDQCFQLRPRHHRRHLGQKHVALRALLLPCKVQRRKAQLRIHLSPPNQGHSVPCSSLLFRNSLIASIPTAATSSALLVIPTAATSPALWAISSPS